MLLCGRRPVDEADVEAVVGTLHDRLTACLDLAHSEDVIVEFAGAPHAELVTLGAAALHVAHYAAGIESREELVTTLPTITASAAAAHGATIRFAKVQAGKGRYPAAPEAQVTDRTRVLAGIDYDCLPVYARAFAALATGRGSASPQTAAARSSSPRTHKGPASKSALSACTGTESWAALGYKRGMCPNTVEYYRPEISLPTFPSLTDDHVERVIDALGQDLRIVCYTVAAQTSSR